MGKIRILIADDHAIVREGTRQIPGQDTDPDEVANGISIICPRSKFGKGARWFCSPSRKPTRAPLFCCQEKCSSLAYFVCDFIDIPKVYGTRWAGLHTGWFKAFVQAVLA